jgi:hypothetical protein
MDIDRKIFMTVPLNAGPDNPRVLRSFAFFANDWVSSQPEWVEITNNS